MGLIVSVVPHWNTVMCTLWLPCLTIGSFLQEVESMFELRVDDFTIHSLYVSAPLLHVINGRLVKCRKWQFCYRRKLRERNGNKSSDNWVKFNNQRCPSVERIQFNLFRPYLNAGCLITWGKVLVEKLAFNTNCINALLHQCIWERGPDGNSLILPYNGKIRNRSSPI